jgi:hypothetical protein
MLFGMRLKLPERHEVDPKRQKDCHRRRENRKQPQELQRLGAGNTNKRIILLLESRGPQTFTALQGETAQMSFSNARRAPPGFASEQL